MMHFRAMDCRKIYGIVTFLLILAVPMVSTKCNFQVAQVTLQKIQIIYDQFKTDMLNQSYTPKPSPQARICGLMREGSADTKEFFTSLEDCSQSVQTGIQREWNALKEYHDQKCNDSSGSAAVHVLSVMSLPLLLCLAATLFQQ